MAISQADWITWMEAATQHLYEVLLSAGPDIATAIEGYRAAAKSSFAADANAAAAEARRALVQLVDSAGIRKVLDPVFRTFLVDLCDNQGITDPVQGAGIIYDELLARGIYVASRGITFDTAPTAGGTGNGAIMVLTTDHRGQTIEGVYAPLDVLVRCIQTNRNAAGEAVFSIGANALLDVLQQGSGRTADPAGRLTAKNSGGLIADGGFGVATAADTSPDSLGAWEGFDGSAPADINGTNFELATTGGVDGSADPYMSDTTEANTGVPLALGMKGNVGVRQQLLTLPELTRPILPFAAVYRPASLTAVDLTLRWGSKSQVFDETDLTADKWTLVYPDLDEDLFRYQWEDGRGYVSWVPSNRAGTGSLWLDCCRVHLMDAWGGLWYQIHAGPTAFLAGANAKTWLFERVLAGSDSIIQTLIHLGYGRYAPTSGSTQLTEPS